MIEHLIIFGPESIRANRAGLKRQTRRVRCERVQDISEDDAICEGVNFGCSGHPDERGDFAPSDVFAHHWDSINGKKPGRAWKDNPRVFVYDYEPLGTKEI